MYDLVVGAMLYTFPRVQSIHTNLHTNFPLERKITKALIGDYGIQQNRQLKVPLTKQEPLQKMVNIKYESVAGITRNTRVYMIYDNKTYPLYVRLSSLLIPITIILCEFNSGL